MRHGGQDARGGGGLSRRAHPGDRRGGWVRLSARRAVDTSVAAIGLTCAAGEAGVGWASAARSAWDTCSPVEDLSRGDLSAGVLGHAIVVVNDAVRWRQRR
jgi:hypothetical protein